MTGPREVPAARAARKTGGVRGRGCDRGPHWTPRAAHLLRLDRRRHPVRRQLRCAGYGNTQPGPVHHPDVRRSRHLARHLRMVCDLPLAHRQRVGSLHGPPRRSVRFPTPHPRVGSDNRPVPDSHGDHASGVAALPCVRTDRTCWPQYPRRWFAHVCAGRQVVRSKTRKSPGCGDPRNGCGRRRFRPDHSGADRWDRLANRLDRARMHQHGHHHPAGTHLPSPPARGHGPPARRRRSIGFAFRLRRICCRPGDRMDRAGSDPYQGFLDAARGAGAGRLRPGRRGAPHPVHDRDRFRCRAGRLRDHLRRGRCDGHDPAIGPAGGADTGPFRGGRVSCLLWHGGGAHAGGHERLSPVRVDDPVRIRGRLKHGDPDVSLGQLLRSGFAGRHPWHSAARRAGRERRGRSRRRLHP